MSALVTNMEVGRVADELRTLLVERFHVARTPEQISVNEPLFEAGVGLSSLEGFELLNEIERKFGIEFHDVEQWVDESPTLLVMAERLIEERAHRLAG